MVNTISGEEETDIEGIQRSDGKFIFIWEEYLSGNNVMYLVLTGADGTQQDDGCIKGDEYKHTEQWEMRGSNTYIIRNFKGMVMIFESLCFHNMKISLPIILNLRKHY